MAEAALKMSCSGTESADARQVALYDRGINLRYTDVKAVMDHHKASKTAIIQFKLSKRHLGGTSNTCGKVVSRGRTVNGHLLVHTRFSLRAANVEDLLARYLEHKQIEHQHQPCAHYSEYERSIACSTDSNQEFDLLLSGLPEVHKFVFCDPVATGTCHRCATDYTIRAFAEIGASSNRFCLEVHVWQDLGSLRTPHEPEWLALTPGGTPLSTDGEHVRETGTIQRAYQGCTEAVPKLSAPPPRVTESVPPSYATAVSSAHNDTIQVTQSQREGPSSSMLQSARSKLSPRIWMKLLASMKHTRDRSGATENTSSTPATPTPRLYDPTTRKILRALKGIDPTNETRDRILSAIASPEKDFRSQTKVLLALKSNSSDTPYSGELSRRVLTVLACDQPGGMAKSLLLALCRRATCAGDGAALRDQMLECVAACGDATIKREILLALRSGNEILGDREWCLRDQLLDALVRL